MPENTLEIEWTCCQLLQRFYHALDARDYDACADCFYDDGYWNRMGEDLNGLTAIRAAMSNRNPKLAIRHVLSNVHPWEVAPEQVIVRSYVSVYLHLFQDAPVVPAPLRDPKSIWALETTFVLRAGRWAIQRHDGALVMTRA